MKTIWEEIEKRLIEKIMEKLEEKKPQSGESEDSPERDPYLVPGVPCEVFDDYDDEGPSLVYFSMLNKNNKPLFTIWKLKVGEDGDLYDHYRVLGTVWDYAPDWAEWVAIRPSGANVFFETEPGRDASGWYTDDNYGEFGYSDPTDWENSLRRRPKWARTGGTGI